jgi:betaine-homocysteine S-methyltransferase
MKKDGILERLSRGIVLGDGGYLLELERRGYVQSGPYTPEVSIRHPEALRQLHIEFLRAGAEVLQTLTFYASRDKLGTAGYADQVEAINRAATRIAREVAGDQALVAGTLSLTWQFDPESPSS